MFTKDWGVRRRENSIDYIAGIVAKLLGGILPPGTGSEVSSSNEPFYQAR
jgi:hypothetical protein